MGCKLLVLSIKSQYMLACTTSRDGFALNIGNSEWQISRVVECYDAAARSNTVTVRLFRLFLSLDMTCVAHHLQPPLQMMRYLLAFVGRSPGQQSRTHISSGTACCASRNIRPSYATAERCYCPLLPARKASSGKGTWTVRGVSSRIFSKTRVWRCDTLSLPAAANGQSEPDIHRFISSRRGSSTRRDTRHYVPWMAIST